MSIRFSQTTPVFGHSSGLRWAVLLLVLLGFGGTRLHAQGLRGGLLDDNRLKRYGLERQWFTHIDVDPTRGRMQSLHQHVSSTGSRTTYEVASDVGSYAFTETDIDRFGTPLGPEKAKAQAEAKVLQLKRMGFEAELKERTVPEITLFAVTDRAVLHVLDGESGLTRWSRRIGDPNHPTLQAGANDEYVAVVNGTYLYVYNHLSGDLAWRRQTKGVPGAGPALSDSFVFIPMVDGAMEAYSLDDLKRPEHIYKSIGKAMIQPIVTPRSIVWPTDRGHFYIAPANRPGIRYRLEANRRISAQAAFIPPDRLCMGSADGYLYCLHEQSGSPVWNSSTGEALSRTPVVAKDRIFLVSDEHNLFCIRAEDGVLQWVTPMISRIISVTKDRLYCLGTTNRLEVLSLDGGGRVASIPVGGVDFHFVNGETDRLFLGTDTGLIQCIRETQQPYPLVHLHEAEEKEREKKKKPDVIQEGPDEKPKPKPPVDPDNPFDAGKPAGGANPFAPGGNDDADAGGGGANPFAPGGNDDADAGGGGANPFAPGGDDDADAGGGGANPFAP